MNKTSVAIAALAACSVAGTGVVLATASPDGAPVEPAMRAPVTAGEDAVGFWAARVATEPTDLVSRTQLAGALLARGLATHNTADAIAADREIDEVLAAIPGDRAAMLVKAQTRMFVHDFAGGQSWAQRVLDMDPTEKSAIAILGDAAFELGDLDDAEAAYDLLEARVGASPEVLARRARLAYTRGDAARAVALVEQAIAGAGTNDASYFHTLLAELQRATGQYEAALATFRRVLDDKPEDGPAIEGLAKVYAALGELGESERWWRRSGALIGAPDFHVLAALGDIAHARGDVPEARDLWEQALAAVDALPAEERVGFLRDVSRFRAARQLDPAESLRLAEQDFSIRHDALAYDTLAWAQLAARRPADARASIDTALSSGIQDAGVWYHASEIYEAVGDRAAARAAIERVRAINPRFDLYESARLGP